MANINCDACESLRQDAPLFVINGLGDDECQSLQNDTGLSTDNENNDFIDLNNMNDCMVGNMATEISAYDVCDWKAFMKKFIPNLWTVLKGIICAIAGLWTNVHTLWCWVQHLANPGENDTLTPDDPRVRYRAVDGVVSRYDPSNPRPNDAPLRIMAIGSVAKVTGSLHFEGNMPASYTGSGARMAWTDFYKGSSGITNEKGRNSYDGNFPSGGVLLYEYEVKSCDWGFETIYTAPLISAEAGDFVARIRCYKDGEEYPYDCGWDANGDGQIYHPTDASKFDTLIQVRMEYINSWGIAHDSGNITPNGTVVVKPCTDSWSC